MAPDSATLKRKRLAQKFRKRLRLSGPQSTLDTTTPRASSSRHHSREDSSSEDEPLNFVHQQNGIPQQAHPGTTDAHKNSRPGWTGLETALRGLHISAELFPPLQSAIGTLTSCLDVFEAATKHREEYDEVASELEVMSTFLAQHLQSPKSTRLTSVIADISQAIDSEMRMVNKQQGRSNSRRILDASKDSDEDDLIKRYRRIERQFRRLQMEVSMSAWSMSNEHLENTYLKGLDPATLASYDSKLGSEINRRTCTENTREKILSELYVWCDDPTAKQVYWMDGMAGTGKTTIACSLAKALESRGQLGASFFCTRTSPECRDANRIVPTIAYQLARYSTPFRAALCQALEENPDIGSRNIVTQFERLLKGPLLQAKEKMPNNLVVVIDALDECDNGSIVKLILEILLRFASGLSIKFFVASRPEPKVHEKMSQNKDSRSVLHLHEIERSLVREDIKLYLREELEFMSPSETDVEKLAELAGNLFIYAATVVRYIRPEEASVDSEERLATMLNVNSKSTEGLADIDELYSTVLAAVFNNKNLYIKDIDRMRLVLRTAVCVREPVSIETLAVLAGTYNKQQVLAALKPLRSVLHVSEISALVSTLHASFPDYIFNQERSGRFFCDEVAHSQFLAQQCFETMKAQLRFNICSLESSFVLDKEVPDLDISIANNISSALTYACSFWGDHLQLAEMSEQLNAMLSEFLAYRLLFWMEVLNLKRCLANGIRVLSRAQTWLASQNSNRTSYLRKFISDAHIFVTRFVAAPISLSTPHVYISALPLCSRSSFVFRHYQSRMQGLMKVNGTAMGRRETTALATLTLNAAVKSVAFSPDGTQIVSGCYDCAIHVWDATHGTLITGPFEGHTAPVTSVAFSPDGTRIVSGSCDRTIRIWDSTDGTVISGPLMGHTGGVWSVGVSPDSTRIVSGSDDRSIRVWDTNNGTVVAVLLEAHTSRVSSVEFSFDGTRIVSGSDDCTICVWDATNRTLIAGPFKGHTGYIMSVGFSHDGTHIVSGSSDCTVRVWNVSTLVATPLEGHTSRILSVGFSSDDTYIVSGSDDCTIRLWDATNRTLVGNPFEGHTARISSVKFSPDSTRIVSSSDDGTIRIWDVTSKSPVADSFKGHPGPVSSVGFSPDGTRIVSGSSDRAASIHIWDATNGALIAGPFKGHTGGIWSVGFSPDGTRIVSGSDDCTVRVWDASCGILVTSPLKKHTKSVKSVAFSPDGVCHIVSGSLDHTICIWDATNGTIIIGPLQGHTDGVWSVGFSPDGKRIVSGSDDCTVCVWDATNGALVAGPFKTHADGIWSVGFSADNKHIVSGSDDHTIYVWDAANGIPLSGPFEGHTKSVLSTRFSPDDKHIISGSDDCTICLWDVTNGTLIGHPLEGHTSGALSVEFSPVDGTRIVSGSPDCTIRVWSIRPTNSTPVALSGPWVVRDDGWLTNTSSELLFWVPQELRNCFPRPYNLFTIGRQGTVQVDYTNMLLGDCWHECYLDS